MFVIVGGGICGLGIGWRLAAAGAPVTVVERGEAGRGATWAAAGMLAPQIEAEPSEEALLPLLLESRAMWPDYAASLTAASGMALGYRDEGTMVVALDRDDREALAFRYDYLGGIGVNLQWLSGAEAREREPHVARTATAAIYSADDHQVDNRRVAQALKQAFLAAGGTLIENEAVAEIVTTGGKASGIRTETREISGEAVVLAAGAWSRGVAGLPDALRPPVRPVKGQMLAIGMDADAPLLRHVLWTPRIYLVPRGDGRLVVGATVEEMGFDTTVTAGGVFELLRRTYEALPGIFDLPLLETWAGLRPASRDDAPILGETALDGLVMATGHHRNGILLAPLTSHAIAELLLTGRAPESIKPFALDRFRPRLASGHAALGEV